MRDTLSTSDEVITTSVVGLLQFNEMSYGSLGNAPVELAVKMISHLERYMIEKHKDDHVGHDKENSIKAWLEQAGNNRISGVIAAGCTSGVIPNAVSQVLARRGMALSDVLSKVFGKHALGATKT